MQQAGCIWPRPGLASPIEQTRLLIWTGAVEHYDQRAVSGLIFRIATTNLLNRLNVATQQLEAVLGKRLTRRHSLGGAVAEAERQQVSKPYINDCRRKIPAQLAASRSLRAAPSSSRSIPSV
jgi:hypothetical protein